MTGILYIVATPIGNLEDITLRAIKTLEEADIIAAEDTRHTLKLLNHLGISKPLISYYKQNEKVKTEVLMEKLIMGKNIALVSDAGTPVISDPGEEIVRVAIENNIKVVPIPGPAALITALIASGMSAKEFSFIGFLPVNKKEKDEILKEISQDTKTLIFYEAPHKLISTLSEMKNILGNRKICLARELTKIHEEFLIGEISDLLEKMQEPKGEYVIIVEGSKLSKKEIEVNKLNEMTVEEHYKYYENLGYEKKDIIKKIAKDRGVSKNDIYINFLKKYQMKDLNLS